MSKARRKLKAARILAGMTQREVAGKINVSESRVTAWETGRADPNPKERAQLSELLNIPSYEVTA